MADRVYVNGPLQPGAVSVTGPEAHHLAVVCRARPGDRVCLFNGDGREYPAEIVAVERRRVGINVLGIETPDRELGFPLLVAAPLPKRDRGQFLVEKLTELGVTRYIPLRTRRTVTRPGDARHEKLCRYVIEASKQCGRNVLMQVEPLTDWATFCGRDDLPPQRVVAHFGGGAFAVPAGQDVALAVGPEGGFTEEEVVAARDHGWQVVGLGPRVLRVETAALVLAAWAVRGGP